MMLLSPMSKLIEGAEARIDAHFNEIAAGAVQKDQEYTIKREAAKAVLAGADPSEAFSAEAALMGISVNDLATIVAGKPDTVAQRGVQRRSAILAARAAKSQDEIEAILNGLTQAS